LIAKANIENAKLSAAVQQNLIGSFGKSIRTRSFESQTTFYQQSTTLQYGHKQKAIIVLFYEKTTSAMCMRIGQKFAGSMGVNEYLETLS
jgi:hypothetical protein